METYCLQCINDSRKQLVLQLEELILLESVEFYRQKGIHWLLAPVTTGAISSPMGLGSDSMPVEISLDGHKTYLADSAQFLLEYGCRTFKTGCWYVMPSFRGEQVDSRHLKQFFHSEVEIPGKLDDVMILAEEYVKHLIEKSMGLIGPKPHLKKALEQEFIRISFDDAERLLGPNDIERHETWRNITTNGEQKLLSHYGRPVWVMNYDEIAVPFYQRTSNGKAENADLLMGIGETIGCGERWSNAEELVGSLKRHQVTPDAYQWYIAMKQAFPMQTAGFGMGIERFLLFVLDLKDIREVQVFRRFNDGKDII